MGTRALCKLQTRIDFCIENNGVSFIYILVNKQVAYEPLYQRQYFYETVKPIGGGFVAYKLVFPHWLTLAFVAHFAIVSVDKFTNLPSFINSLVYLLHLFGKNKYITLNFIVLPSAKFDRDTNETK